MNILFLLALSVAPGLALMVYIYYKDKHEKEPIKLLAKCFFGGAVSIFPAVILEEFGGSLGFEVSTNSIITFLYAFGVVGLSEELCKMVVVYYYAYRSKEFNEPFDGIVYSVMVSMGFATFENILYVAEGGLTTAMLRMFTAVPAHATFAVIMGYFLGKAKFDKENSMKFKLYALLGAVLFHGAYDYFLFEMNVPGIWTGAFISLAVALYLSKKAIKLHQGSSPFKPL